MKQFLSSFKPFSLVLIVTVTTALLVLTSFLSSDQPADFTVPDIISDKKASDLYISPTNMLNAWYGIECVKPFSKLFDPAQYNDLFQDQSTDNQIEYCNLDLVVRVDTLTELSISKRPIWTNYWLHDKSGNKTAIVENDDNIQEVKSFPIFIANLSESKNALIETQNGSLLMILEAQNNQKQWKPIEYWSHSWCGNSYAYLAIPPRHFAFTRGIKCSGDFLTTCRLKVFNEQDSLYSNEFRMSINKTQFEKPVNEEMIQE